MTQVVTLGECLVAFVATTPGPLAEAATFERFIVGAEANVAVGLARLGHSVAYIGRVGADGFGEAIARRLRGEGVDISDLAVDPDAATGLTVPGKAPDRTGAGRVRPERIGGLAPDRRRGRAGAGATYRDSLAPPDGHHAGPVRRRPGGDRPRDRVRAKRRPDDQPRPEPAPTAAGRTRPPRPSCAELAARVDVILGSPDELAVLTRLTADHDPAELARGGAGSRAVDRRRQAGRPSAPSRSLATPPRRSWSGRPCRSP